MVRRELKVFIEGHEGHRGNALAHALVAKLGQLLGALAQFERKYLQNTKRRTDYEIVDTKKWNPTELVLRPVPKVMRYDPIPAFDWTIEQFESLAKGKVLDDRIDAMLADSLVSLAEKNNQNDYSKFWLDVDGIRVDLDETFRLNALKVAEQKKDIEKADHLWVRGVSFGSVVGEIRQISDLDGEQRFVITPPLGSKHIECTFKEEDRELMRTNLWKVVRVHGLLHYSDASPFPYAVDMVQIDQMPSGEKRISLRELRGIFKGLERGDFDGIVNV